MKKSPAYFYSELLQVLDMRQGEALGYTVAECYTELHRVFNEALMTLTADNRLDFSGAFARFTYLAQNAELDEGLIAAVNAFRGRVKEQNYPAEWFAYDLKAVADFFCKVFHVAVPDRLLAALPKDYRQHRLREQKTASCIRVSVTSWDAYYIDALADDESGTQLKVCYNTDANFLGNWQYIGKLLRAGDQLNLVRPYMKDGICYPELIIFQPDYLMDISGIAACFEPYGATAYNYLLKKLEPNQPSRPMLLGNFASQLLDEQLNREQPVPYEESATTFFRQNALNLAACKDDMSDFHKDAQAQRKNLCEILHTAFTEDHLIDAGKILLEPSFFCEMLGVQGRMDLLQTDYRVLMEQKSGKKDYKTGGHVQKHYCQMLLYLALLHYGFGLRNDEVSCFLLYSKYPDGLIKEAAAPKLLFEILRVRNQVVWMEFYLSRGGARLLETLTVGKVNVRHLNDRFARQYLLPPVEQKLHIIQSATPLERDYFFRFFTFVQREHVLAKIGNSQKEASGFSTLWNCTLDEKLLAGNIFCNLTILSLEGTLGVERVELLVPESDGDYLPNFRVGDIVILYKYTREEMPDVRRGMVFRASIEEIRTDSLRLLLRAPQKNRDLFQQDSNTCWAVEPDFMESSYSALYRSLFAFLTANKDRRDLLLAQRRATADDYCILIGPPGTGKTSFGLMKRLRSELENPAHSVLLLSYTNRAVDEICSKLLKDGLDFLRIGSRLSCPEVYRPYLLEEKVKACRNVTQIRQLLIAARIVVGTTASVTSHQGILALRSFSLAIVDEASQILEPHLLGILSAKCGEENSVQRFFLIGDHKQLPAVVAQTEEESAVSQSSLQAIGLTNCRNSLFERLLRISPPELIERFTRQGRMHRDVAQFPCDHFYEGLLGVVPLPHQECPLDFPQHKAEGMEKLLATNRIAFIDVPTPRHSPSAKVNQNEAECIADAVLAVYNLYTNNGHPFMPEETVGVIVPYRNQIAAVRREIERRFRSEGIFTISQDNSKTHKLKNSQTHKLNNSQTYKLTNSQTSPPWQSITIDTVERYQGSERDVIIYGFTVQHEYQLDFLTNNTFTENGCIIDRKLNVALTRAREQMLLLGCRSLLSQNPVFKKLIDCTIAEKN